MGSGWQLRASAHRVGFPILLTDRPAPEFAIGANCRVSRRASHVEPADVSDHKAGYRLLGGLRFTFPGIRTVIADAGAREPTIRRDPKRHDGHELGPGSAAVCRVESNRRRRWIHLRWQGDAPRVRVLT